MQRITSEQNANLKKAIRLHESRGRRQQGRIIIFGAKEICRARDCDVSFKDFFLCDELASTAARELVRQVDGSPTVRHYALPPQLFRKLTYGDRTDGIVATARRPATDLERLPPPPKNALVLVLDSIEKPGNIGAVYRSADAAGVDAILLANPITDPFHPNAIRSSLGAVFSIPTVCASNSAVRKFLQKFGFGIFATRVDRGSEYFNVDLTRSAAIVFGSEAHGLGGEWSDEEITDMTVPMRGKTDSLNVAMAATIVMYEAFRQRHQNAKPDTTA